MILEYVRSLTPSCLSKVEGPPTSAIYGHLLHDESDRNLGCYSYCEGHFSTQLEFISGPAKLIIEAAPFETKAAVNN